MEVYRIGGKYTQEAMLEPDRRWSYIYDDIQRVESFVIQSAKECTTPAKAGTTRVCIPVDAPGVYAAGAYHDRNANRRFDKNWLGIPVERFGVSNNPSMTFGAPPFEEAAFEVGANGIDLTIKLRSALE